MLRIVLFGIVMTYWQEDSDCNRRPRESRGGESRSQKLTFEELESRSLLSVSSPWLTADVGVVSEGFETMTPGGGAFGVTATVGVGGAAGVGGVTDEVRFVYQYLVGDGQITARVADLLGDDWWASGGLSIRESLAAGAPNASLVSWSAGITTFSARDVHDDSTSPLATALSGAESYLRLSRAANTFTAYVSADGASWTSLGSHLLVMGETALIGLITSSSLTEAGRASADYANVEGPRPTENQSLSSVPVGIVAKYSSAWETWPAGAPQSGKFQYLWNSPVNWSQGSASADWNTGAVSDPASFRPLTYVVGVDGTFNAFKVDGDVARPDADPAGYLSLRSGLVHPGRAAGFAGSTKTNGVARYAIVAYTVPNLDPDRDEGGFFSIEDSILSKSSAVGDGLEVFVFTSADPASPKIRSYAAAVGGGSTVDREAIDFDGYLGYVPEGGVIYVAVGADGSDLSDESQFDFSISRTEPLVVADLKDDFPKSAGENLAPGWSVLWNPPTGWTPAGPSGDLATGVIGSAANYAAMFRQPASTTWTPSGSPPLTSAEPAGGAQIAFLGGDVTAVPGRSGPQQSPVAYDRYVIAAFEAPQSGLYALHDAWAEKLVDSGDPVEIRIYVGDRLVSTESAFAGPGAGKSRFSGDLGYVAKGETVYVALGPDGDDQADLVRFDFTVTEYAPRQKPLRASDLTPTLTITVPAPVYSSPGVQNAIQNTANIQAALTQAHNHTEGAANSGKVARVRLAAGQTYELDKSGIVLNSSSQQFLFRVDGYERIIFDGQGATLLVKNAQVGVFLGRQDGSDVTEKLVFQNFTIDYAQSALPFTQGVISSVTQLDSNSAKVKFDVDLGQYASPLDAKFSPASASGYLYEIVNGQATGRMLDGSWSSWVSDSSYSSSAIVHEAGDPANRFTHFVTRTPGLDVLLGSVGQGWLVHSRYNANFYFAGPDWITLDNVTSWASSGTFLTYFGSDHVSVLNSKLEIKPGSGRYQSSSADALHGRGREGLWIENSKFEAAGDDLFNAYGVNYVLLSQPNSTTLQLGVFSTSNPTTPTSFAAGAFVVGDQLAFFDPVTGAVLGKRRVTSVNVSTQRVTLDAPISGLPLFAGDPPGAANAKTNMFVMNVEAAANYLIRDSQFLNSFRFSLFIKANDVFVLGNQFTGGLEQAIMAVNEPSWPEGFVAERLWIQGNVFADNARGAMSRNRYFLSRDPATILVGVYLNPTGSTASNDFAVGLRSISHVTILDNVFEDWRGMAVSVRNARDVLIRGNTFAASYNDLPMRSSLDATSTTPGGRVVPPGPPLYDSSDNSGKYAAVYLHDDDGVRVDDNVFDLWDDTIGNEDDEDLSIAWLASGLKHLMIDGDDTP